MFKLFELTFKAFDVVVAAAVVVVVVVAAVVVIVLGYEARASVVLL